MIVKIIGAIVIVAATSLIGIEFAARFERRKRSIADFRAAFGMLESEISFSLNPLQTAFQAISGQLSGPVGEFFSEVSSKVQQSSLNVSKTWTQELEKQEKRLCLVREDVQILSAFGTGLGKTDRENQLKSIHHTISQLEIQAEQAQQACDKNKKMYQSFGVLSGILIAILLF